MTKPIPDPVTGKIDHHSAKQANRARDLARSESKKEARLNDGRQYPLALIQPLAITPYQSKQVTQHLRDRAQASLGITPKKSKAMVSNTKTAMMFLREGTAENVVPFIPQEYGVAA